MSKARLFDCFSGDGSCGDDFESKFISLWVLLVLGGPSIGQYQRCCDKQKGEADHRGHAARDTDGQKSQRVGEDPGWVDLDALGCPRGDLVRVQPVNEQVG